MSLRALRHLTQLQCRLYSSSPQVNWGTPGHMQKAVRDMQARLKQVDLVLEVRDARVPLSARSSVMEDLLRGKRRLVVLNKADLVPKEDLQAALHSLGSCSHLRTLTASANDRESTKRLMRTALGVISTERPTADESLLMVVGLPNAGKSSVINGLKVAAARAQLLGGHDAYQKKARIGPLPGVTRTLGSFQLSKKPRAFVLDTPGVLPPSIQDPTAALHIALTGGMPTTAIDSALLVRHLLALLLDDPHLRDLLMRQHLKALPEDNPTRTSEASQYSQEWATEVQGAQQLHHDQQLHHQQQQQQRLARTHRRAQAQQQPPHGLEGAQGGTADVQQGVGVQASAAEVQQGGAEQGQQASPQGLDSASSLCPDTAGQTKKSSSRQGELVFHDSCSSVARALVEALWMAVVRREQLQYSNDNNGNNNNNSPTGSRDPLTHPHNTWQHLPGSLSSAGPSAAFGLAAGRASSSDTSEQGDSFDLADEAADEVDSCMQHLIVLLSRGSRKGAKGGGRVGHKVQEVPISAVQRQEACDRVLIAFRKGMLGKLMLDRPGQG